MYEFISDVCDNIGPRASASEEEKLAADKIEGIFREYCDESCQEDFTLSPMAFLGGIKYGVLILFGGVLMYWFSLLIDNNILLMNSLANFIILIIGVILVTSALLYFILEVIMQFEVFDFLFPKKKSQNVIGTINPKEEVKHHIVIGAHHDSAYVFNLFYLGTLGAVLIFVGFILIFLISIYVWLKFIIFFIPIDMSAWFNRFGISMLIFVPVGSIFLFFIRKEAVPGAYDNLSGVSILLAIAKYFSENRNNENKFPKHTKISLISFGSEEAGTRGSRRYVEKHLQELKKSKAKMLNIDSISMKNKVLIVNKETLSGVKHNKKLSEELVNIGKELNIGIKLGALPFGGSDAVPFTRKKIPATSFMTFVMPKLPPYYHILKDTPEVVDKESLGQIMQICLEYIKKEDIS